MGQMLGELQKPPALCTGREAGVVKELMSEGFSPLRRECTLSLTGRKRHILRGLSRYTAPARSTQTPSATFGVGSYSLGGNTVPGLAHRPFSWVGLECVSVYPEACARDPEGGESDQNNYERKALEAKSLGPGSYQLASAGQNHLPQIPKAEREGENCFQNTWLHQVLTSAR